MLCFVFFFAIWLRCCQRGPVYLSPSFITIGNSSTEIKSRKLSLVRFAVVWSLTCVWLFATPWTVAHWPPCPSPSPGVRSNSCPLSRWCHPTISSSVSPFSSCPQSFPASGYSLQISFKFFPSVRLYVRMYNYRLCYHIYRFVKPPAQP